jgi:hypothetical protein
MAELAGLLRPAPASWTYLRWFRAAGLVRVWDRYVPEGASGHALILARAS